ncbi:unnamed protein product, partial [Didymodactylos carnosus]
KENILDDKNELQVLLLNCQQQLEKLRRISQTVDTSVSEVDISQPSSTSVQNQINDYIRSSIETQTNRLNDNEKRLMNHFELIQRLYNETRNVKENIIDCIQWLEKAREQFNIDFLNKSLSLNRSKLDDQIIFYRQYDAQLRTRRHSFSNIIKTQSQLLNVNDENSQLETIENNLKDLELNSNNYNEKINRLSLKLNEYLLLHAQIIDSYAKQIRQYEYYIKENDFSYIKQLLSGENNENYEQKLSLYNQTVENLLIENDGNLIDQDEILTSKLVVQEHHETFQRLISDLTLILNNREQLTKEYNDLKIIIDQWFISSELVLKQIEPIPFELDACLERLDKCNLLNKEYQTICNNNVNRLKILSDEILCFYTSSNIDSLLDTLKIIFESSTRFNDEQISKNDTNDNEQITIAVTKNIIECYQNMGQRIQSYIDYLTLLIEQIETYKTSHKQAKLCIEQTNELLDYDIKQNQIILLPIEQQELDLFMKKYQDIDERLKSSNVIMEDYRTTGFSLINGGQNRFDTKIINDEMEEIDHLWSDYVEHIRDMIDYIQLQKDELLEFNHLSKDLLTLIQEKQCIVDILDIRQCILSGSSYNQHELREQIEQIKQIYDKIEKQYERVEDLNLKGEILLERCSVNENMNKNNVIEQIMENVNKKYDNLTVKAKYSLDNLTQIKDHIQQFETQLLLCHNFIEKIDDNVRMIVVDLDLSRLSWQNAKESLDTLFDYLKSLSLFITENDVEIQQQEIRNLESYILPLRQRLNSEERLLKQIELKFNDIKRKLLEKQERRNDIEIKLNQFEIWLNERIIYYNQTYGKQLISADYNKLKIQKDDYERFLTQLIDKETLTYELSQYFNDESEQNEKYYLLIKQYKTLLKNCEGIHNKTRICFDLAENIKLSTTTILTWIDSQEQKNNDDTKRLNKEQLLEKIKEDQVCLIVFLNQILLGEIEKRHHDERTIEGDLKELILMSNVDHDIVQNIVQSLLLRLQTFYNKVVQHRQINELLLTKLNEFNDQHELLSNRIRDNDNGNDETLTSHIKMYNNLGDELKILFPDVNDQQLINDLTKNLTSNFIQQEKNNLLKIQTSTVRKRLDEIESKIQMNNQPQTLEELQTEIENIKQEIQIKRSEDLIETINDEQIKIDILTPELIKSIVNKIHSLQIDTKEKISSYEKEKEILEKKHEKTMNNMKQLEILVEQIKQIENENEFDKIFNEQIQPLKHQILLGEKNKIVLYIHLNN